MIQNTKYTHRFLARFIIEAKTPLAIGSGQKDILSDSLVALDANGLPYIPGTSLAGVIRSILDPEKESPVFGFQNKGNKDKTTGKGSEIVFTEGRILDSTGKVVDGLARKSELKRDSLLSEYLKALPIRQHVCINEYGTAKDGGKFDQQVVFAGTRFCFEIELVSTGTDAEDEKRQIDDLLNAVYHRTFRLGGGSRKGYGEIEVIEAKTSELDLTQLEQLNIYLSKSSNLSETWNGWKTLQFEPKEDPSFVHYEVSLKPEDFMLFGSGFGDEQGDADMTSVKARKVHWDKEGRGKLESGLVLIPGSSLKGALRHRVAYRYNQLLKRYIDKEGGEQPKVADQNEAVCRLFGSQSQDEDSCQAGFVLFSDVIQPAAEHKLVNHVSIDRFTGGAMDGFLFTEQVDFTKGREFKFDIYVDKNAYPESDGNIRKAFEESLKDLCNGMLPLGGGVNRGNGIFTGSIKIDNELFYESK